MWCVGGRCSPGVTCLLSLGMCSFLLYVTTSSCNFDFSPYSIRSVVLRQCLICLEPIILIPRTGSPSGPENTEAVIGSSNSADYLSTDTDLTPCLKLSAHWHVLLSLNFERPQICIKCSCGVRHRAVRPIITFMRLR